ncbi:DUF1003 domain-containing protein [Patescibacteria group bacterium]|nr:DUF1003 domain-containing protein [Patescibacteria group bacterium]
MKDCGGAVAEKVAAVLGSWWFLGIQTVAIGVWMTWNAFPGHEHPDPYPFILLNLALSLQAAYAGPLLLQASNRVEARDRKAAEHRGELQELIEREVRGIAIEIAKVRADGLDL